MDEYKDTITDELLRLAKRNFVSVYHLNMKSETPDVASPLDSTVIMNPNFKINVSFNYRLAHELSHILYGEVQYQSVYQFSEFGKRGEELLAHRNAIRMLMSIEMPSSPLTFMSYYRVPSWLENDVLRTYNELNIVEWIYVPNNHIKRFWEII